MIQDTKRAGTVRYVYRRSRSPMLLRGLLGRGLATLGLLLLRGDLARVLLRGIACRLVCFPV